VLVEFDSKKSSLQNAETDDSKGVTGDSTTVRKFTILKGATMNALNTLINTGKLVIVMAALSSVVACGASQSSSTGTGASTSASTTSTTAATSSAAAGLFSGGASSSISAIPSSLVTQFVEASEEAEESQGETCNTQGETPDDITIAYYGDAGTYGADDDYIIVDEEDFCTDSDGVAHEGTGPDGNGLFATFEIQEQVTGDCEDENGDSSEIVMESGSAGIWRNTDTHYPEIYATMILSMDGETVEVDCTIYLNEDETVDSASCTDENGYEVEQENEMSCEFSTDEE